MMNNIKKRINYEYKQSLHMSDLYIYENNVSFIYKDRYIFSFLIPNSYPFYPPKNITVNFKNLLYHELGNKSVIRKYFNISCLCCKSISCANNWLPTTTLEKIAVEYELFKDIINCSMVIPKLEKMLPFDITKQIVTYIK